MERVTLTPSFPQIDSAYRRLLMRDLGGRRGGAGEGVAMGTALYRPGRLPSMAWRYRRACVMRRLLQAGLQQHQGRRLPRRLRSVLRKHGTRRLQLRARLVVDSRLPRPACQPWQQPVPQGTRPQPSPRPDSAPCKTGAADVVGGSGDPGVTFTPHSKDSNPSRRSARQAQLCGQDRQKQAVSEDREDLRNALTITSITQVRRPWAVTPTKLEEEEEKDSWTKQVRALRRDRGYALMRIIHNKMCGPKIEALKRARKALKLEPQEPAPKPKTLHYISECERGGRTYREGAQTLTDDLLRRLMQLYAQQQEDAGLKKEAPAPDLLLSPRSPAVSPSPSPPSSRLGSIGRTNFRLSKLKLPEVAESSEHVETPQEPPAIAAPELKRSSSTSVRKSTEWPRTALATAKGKRNFKRLLTRGSAREEALKVSPEQPASPEYITEEESKVMDIGWVDWDKVAVLSVHDFLHELEHMEKDVSEIELPESQEIIQDQKKKFKAGWLVKNVQKLWFKKMQNEFLAHFALKASKREVEDAAPQLRHQLSEEIIRSKQHLKAVISEMGDDEESMQNMIEGVLEKVSIIVKEEEELSAKQETRRLARPTTSKRRLHGSPRGEKEGQRKRGLSTRKRRLKPSIKPAEDEEDEKSLTEPAEDEGEVISTHLVEKEADEEILTQPVEEEADEETLTKHVRVSGDARMSIKSAADTAEELMTISPLEIGIGMSPFPSDYESAFGSSFGGTLKYPKYERGLLYTAWGDASESSSSSEAEPTPSFEEGGAPSTDTLMMMMEEAEAKMVIQAAFPGVDNQLTETFTAVLSKATAMPTLGPAEERSQISKMLTTEGAGSLPRHFMEKLVQIVVAMKRRVPGSPAVDDLMLSAFESEKSDKEVVKQATAVSEPCVVATLAAEDEEEVTFSRRRKQGIESVTMSENIMSTLQKTLVGTTRRGSPKRIYARRPVSRPEQRAKTVQSSRTTWKRQSGEKRDSTPTGLKKFGGEISITAVRSKSTPLPKPAAREKAKALPPVSDEKRKMASKAIEEEATKDRGRSGTVISIVAERSEIDTLKGLTPVDASVGQVEGDIEEEDADLERMAYLQTKRDSVGSKPRSSINSIIAEGIEHFRQSTKSSREIAVPEMFLKEMSDVLPPNIIERLRISLAAKGISLRTLSSMPETETQSDRGTQDVKTTEQGRCPIQKITERTVTPGRWKAVKKSADTDSTCTHTHGHGHRGRKGSETSLESAGKSSAKEATADKVPEPIEEESSSSKSEKSSKSSLSCKEERGPESIRRKGSSNLEPSFMRFLKFSLKKALFEDRAAMVFREIFIKLANRRVNLKKSEATLDSGGSSSEDVWSWFKSDDEEETQAEDISLSEEEDTAGTPEMSEEEIEAVESEVAIPPHVSQVRLPSLPDLVFSKESASWPPWKKPLGLESSPLPKQSGMRVQALANLFASHMSHIKKQKSEPSCKPEVEETISQKLSTETVQLFNLLQKARDSIAQEEDGDVTDSCSEESWSPNDVIPGMDERESQIWMEKLIGSSRSSYAEVKSVWAAARKSVEEVEDVQRGSLTLEEPEEKSVSLPLQVIHEICTSLSMEVPKRKETIVLQEQSRKVKSASTLSITSTDRPTPQVVLNALSKKHSQKIKRLRTKGRKREKRSSKSHRKPRSARSMRSTPSKLSRRSPTRTYSMETLTGMVNTARLGAGKKPTRRCWHLQKTEFPYYYFFQGEHPPEHDPDQTCADMLGIDLKAPELDLREMFPSSSSSASTPSLSTASFLGVFSDMDFNFSSVRRDFRLRTSGSPHEGREGERGGEGEDATSNAVSLPAGSPAHTQPVHGQRPKPPQRKKTAPKTPSFFRKKAPKKSLLSASSLHPNEPVQRDGAGKLQRTADTVPCKDVPSPGRMSGSEAKKSLVILGPALSPQRTDRHVRSSEKLQAGRVHQPQRRDDSGKALHRIGRPPNDVPGKQPISSVRTERKPGLDTFRLTATPSARRQLQVRDPPPLHSARAAAETRGLFRTPETHGETRRSSGSEDLNSECTVPPNSAESSLSPNSSSLRRGDRAEEARRLGPSTAVREQPDNPPAYDFPLRSTAETLDSVDVQPLSRHSSVFWLYSPDIDLERRKDRDENRYQREHPKPSCPRPVGMDTAVFQAVKRCAEEASVKTLPKLQSSPALSAGPSSRLPRICERFSQTGDSDSKFLHSTPGQESARGRATKEVQVTTRYSGSERLSKRRGNYSKYLHSSVSEKSAREIVAKEVETSAKQARRIPSLFTQAVTTREESRPIHIDRESRVVKAKSLIDRIPGLSVRKRSAWTEEARPLAFPPKDTHPRNDIKTAPVSTTSSRLSSPRQKASRTEKSSSGQKTAVPKEKKRSELKLPSLPLKKPQRQDRNSVSTGATMPRQMRKAPAPDRKETLSTDKKSNLPDDIIPAHSSTSSLPLMMGQQRGDHGSVPSNASMSTLVRERLRAARTLETSHEEKALVPVKTSHSGVALPSSSSSSGGKPSQGQRKIRRIKSCWESLPPLMHRK